MDETERIHYKHAQHGLLFVLKAQQRIGKALACKDEDEDGGNENCKGQGCNIEHCCEDCAYEHVAT